SGSATFTCGGGGAWTVSSATCVQSSSCPPQKFSWTSAAGDVCSGSAGLTAPSSSATITSSNATTGSATFVCNSDGTWATTPTSSSCACTAGYGFEAKIDCCKGCGIDTETVPGFSTL